MGGLAVRLPCPLCPCLPGASSGPSTQYHLAAVIDTGSPGRPHAPSPHAPSPHPSTLASRACIPARSGDERERGSDARWGAA
ncbi:hypothetical protein C8F04DRAFT_1275217 [Mycena alexandri]|uniref:Uncharacterized protein n=1 Tax=Mycena alexandri TaxID=1745969 RepID=A0AAD6WPD7_9AGAR|nr:hypothetical protein C8F04DRAFT_1275217 [Mycena alexandri]